MAYEITQSGGLFKIKNTSTGLIKAIAKDDVRFELNDNLEILKGATLPILVISNANQVTTPSESNLSDLLTTLSNLT